MAIIKVIIPAYNEQNSIAKVLGDIPQGWVEEVVVVNNNSNDHTVVNAQAAGATVLEEHRQGYGYACLCGIAYVSQQTTKPDIIVFMDADYSDHPEELPALVQPIVDDKADLVIGSRSLGQRERGAMTPQQVWGNWLATKLLKWLYGAHFTDLGPFRAIRYESLIQLGMRDQTYGWTVEMQLKAAQQGLRCVEVPVRYRQRIGVSKVSGTVKGTIMAGYKIIGTIIKYW